MLSMNTFKCSMFIFKIAAVKKYNHPKINLVYNSSCFLGFFLSILLLFYHSIMGHRIQVKESDITFIQDLYTIHTVSIRRKLKTYLFSKAYPP